MTYNLLKAIDNKYLAIPSRPRRWLEQESPGIYPVSCTMIALQDCAIFQALGTSFFETLLGSLEFTGRVLKGNGGSTVDLSKVNSTFSGHGSSLKIILDIEHPDLEDFLAADFKAEKYIKVRDYFDTIDPKIRSMVNNGEAYLVVDNSGILTDLNYIPLEDTCYSSDPEENETSIFGGLMSAYCSMRLTSKVYVDFSNLRAKGSENEYGMVASGPVSFMSLYDHLATITESTYNVVDFMTLYSKVNETIRKGNTFKNGAVTLFMNWDHPHIEQYLNTPASELPWASRAVYVDDGLLQENNSDILDLILERSAEGVLWWAKKRYDANGRRLYSNTCLETLIPSRGTCNIAGVNLGMIKPFDFLALNDAFRAGMLFLCELFAQSDLNDGLFLERSQDKQVLLQVIGFANLLANWGLTYQEVVTSFYLHEQKLADGSRAAQLVKGLYEAYEEASKIAKEYGMERAFGIAPTESVSYRHTDYLGVTTTPEISPPLCDPDTKIVNRGTMEDQDLYTYPQNVEIANHDVPFILYFYLACSWQRMMNSTGLAHSISFNQWIPGCKFDREYFKSWYHSPLVTSYYTLLVDQTAQDKTSIGMEVEDTGFWTFDDDEEEESEPLYVVPAEEEPKPFYPIRREGCAACAGG